MPDPSVPDEATRLELGDAQTRHVPGREATEERFREVMGRFVSGVTVVTGIHDGEPVGLTCQAFTSVSLEPPLVLFAASRRSLSWPLIRSSGAFAVNLLAAEQSGLSQAFATRGADKFAGVDWAPGDRTGSPVISGTVGHVECRLHDVHDGGDHEVVLGLVVGLANGPTSDPLLYHRGAYARLR